MMLLKTDNSKILILVSTTFQDANIHITDFKPPLAGTVLKHSAVGSHIPWQCRFGVLVGTGWTYKEWKEDGGTGGELSACM